jgi:hypothetical protein
VFGADRDRRSEGAAAFEDLTQTRAAAASANVTPYENPQPYVTRGLHADVFPTTSVASTLSPLHANTRNLLIHMNLTFELVIQTEMA